MTPELLDPRLKKDKIRDDPIATRRPEMPMQGPIGKGGRFSQSGTLSKYIMSNL